MAAIESLVTQQWSQLMTILSAEMVTGKRLASLKDLRKSLHLWTGIMPAAGVQPQRVSEKPDASRRHLVTTTFNVIVGTESVAQTVGNNTTPANLDDAMAQLQVLLDDGQGNGICAVLRDPLNFGLSGNAYRTAITSIEYSAELGVGENPELFAYGLITYVAEQVVSI